MAKEQGQNARLPRSDNLGVIHNHQQIDAASIREQFADTGANGRYGIDRETEVEMQVVSQMEKEEECADDDDLPFQLTSYSCYGREKSLNDVSLPRIPAVLECLVLPCNIDYDYTEGLLYQNKPASRRDLTLGATGGRGRQLMANINSLNANQVRVLH